MQGSAGPIDLSETKAKRPHVCFRLRPAEGDRLLQPRPIGGGSAVLVYPDNPNPNVVPLIGAQGYGWKTTPPPSPGRTNVAQFTDIIVESGEPMAFTPARNPRVIKLPGSRTPNKPRGCTKRVFVVLASFARFVLRTSPC
ncbi:hypothetical protein VTN00DRAFT_5530 [Thermoascus crustaceus]|uniref:uncharacterized protein n=1 Tax=Thermoascus crustaceus TaxID=5088 RepID=UPI0037447759